MTRTAAALIYIIIGAWLTQVSFCEHPHPETKDPEPCPPGWITRTWPVLPGEEILL